MFKLLADENIAPRVIAALRERGFDTVSVRDLMPTASDIAIMEWAFSEQRTILTHDRDFGNVRSFPVHGHHGVILVRLRDQRPAAVIARLLVALERYREEQFIGRVFVVQESAVRSLPPI